MKHGGTVLVLASIPALWDELTAEVAAGGRFADLFGTAPAADGLLLTAHLAGPAGWRRGRRCCPRGGSYPALTPRLGAAFWYEREIHDMFGVVPEGHPRLAAADPGHGWRPAPAGHRPSRQPPSVPEVLPSHVAGPACSPSRTARCAPASSSPSSTWWRPRARTSRT